MEGISMGAPKGNKFWLLRSKHGRDKLFATPELLWQAACEYFTWCEANPLISVEYYGKDAKECYVPKARAFTMHGLCSYLDCNVGYFSDFKKALKETDKDYSSVITRIEQIVYQQKFEHAAAGLLNASIIARDLGLADKKELGGTNGSPIQLVFNEAPGCEPIKDEENN